MEESPVLRCLSIFLLLLTSLPLGSPANAQALPPTKEVRYYVPDVPEDMSQVDFFLVTGGLGDEVANRFGHTGIRVLDHVNRMDVVFNWGKFSFEQRGFLWKFFRGSLTYSMGVRTLAADKEHYYEDQRRLVMEPLNLTVTQKRKLLEKIAWNAVPEHRDFAYQYWFKNCATIPRDYIDEALDGQLRAKFAALDAGHSFRHYMRRNLEAIPFVASSLDVLMNGNIDRNITAWEEMFLPEMLRERLREMPAIDDDGNPVPGQMLLGETKVIADYDDQFGRPFNDYAAMAALGLVPLAAALILRARRTASARLLGLSTLLWGLLAGIFGLTLLINWVLSGHPDGWANINLLILSPLDLFIVPVGWALLRRGERVKDRTPFMHAGGVMAVAHGVCLVAVCALAASGVVKQDIWRVAVWFGIPTVAVYAALNALGFERAASSAPILAAEASPVGERKARSIRS